VSINKQSVRVCGDLNLDPLIFIVIVHHYVGQNLYDYRRVNVHLYSHSVVNKKNCHA